MFKNFEDLYKHVEQGLLRFSEENSKYIEGNLVDKINSANQVLFSVGITKDFLKLKDLYIFGCDHCSI